MAFIGKSYKGREDRQAESAGMVLGRIDYRLEGQGSRKVSEKPNIISSDTTGEDVGYSKLVGPHSAIGAVKGPN